MKKGQQPAQNSQKTVIFLAKKPVSKLFLIFSGLDNKLAGTSFLGGMLKHKWLFDRIVENKGDAPVRVDLIRRRRRMLTLLGLGNSLQAVVSALAKEFNRKEVTIYADYERISTWAPVVEQDEVLTALIKARLDYLNREALEMMQNIENKGSTVKEKLIKLGAINSVLKITVEQIKLGQELGLIERSQMLSNPQSASLCRLRLPLKSKPPMQS
jgi:hypothetical protein